MVAPDGKSWNFWRENPRQLGMPHTLECPWLGQTVLHHLASNLVKRIEVNDILFSMKSNASPIGEVLLEFWPGTSLPPLRRFHAKKPTTSASRSSRLGMSMAATVVAVLTYGYAHCGCGARKVFKGSFHSMNFRVSVPYCMGLHWTSTKTHVGRSFECQNCTGSTAGACRPWYSSLDAGHILSVVSQCD